MKSGEHSDSFGFLPAGSSLGVSVMQLARRGAGAKHVRTISVRL